MFLSERQGDEHDEIGGVPGSAKRSLAHRCLVDRAHVRMRSAPRLPRVQFRGSLNFGDIRLHLGQKLHVWHAHKQFPRSGFVYCVTAHVPTCALEEESANIRSIFCFRGIRVFHLERREDSEIESSFVDRYLVVAPHENTQLITQLRARMLRGGVCYEFYQSLLVCLCSTYGYTPYASTIFTIPCVFEQNSVTFQ